MRRRLRIALVGIVLASVLPLIAPIGVGAYSASATIMRHYCHYGISWRGSVDWIYGSQVTGKLDHCTTELKLSDQDPDYDYYAIVDLIDWNTGSWANSGYTPHDSYGRLNVWSNVGGATYDATRTITSSSCWNSPISVGLTVYGLYGVSVSPVLCNSATLTRDYKTSTGAEWGSGWVVDTPVWELTYEQQVAQGAKPTWSSWLQYPLFNSTGKQSGCGPYGWCYKYTTAWGSDRFSYTTP